MADSGAGEHLPERGRVKKVRQEWLVHEDGALAHNLQQKEYGEKYQWNKDERRTARTDVPLAKYVQTEEEERKQREELEKLERQRAIAERDAEIAREVQQLEEQKRKITAHVSNDDAIVAQQFQQQEMVELERERIRRELRDEEYARQLQEKERRRLERRKQQRELALEQKALEAEQQRRAQQLIPGFKSDGKGAPQSDCATGEVSPGRTSSIPSMGMENLEISEGGQRVLRTDGRVEDAGDFSDFYIQPPENMVEHQKRELQQLQDEELARLLQDQERKRGAKVNKESLKELEARDAEIARLMQEQEKLKARRKQRSRTQPEQGARPQASVGGARHLSEGDTPGIQGRVPPSYGRYRSEPSGVDLGENPPPVPAKSAASYHYDRENSYNESMNNANGREDDSLPRESRSLPTQHYQGRSPYQQRPLPDTPPNSGHNFTVVEVDTSRLSPQGSPPPPGYRPPPAYPSKRQDSNPRRSNESSSSGNVIAAIDPTYRDMSPPQQSPPPRPEQGNSPNQHHTGPRGTDDSYCDLDDLGPVQGQKRASLPKNGNMSKRDSKNRNSSNCKQQ